MGARIRPEIGERRVCPACTRCDGPRSKEWTINTSDKVPPGAAGRPPKGYWRKIPHTCTRYLLSRIQSLVDRMEILEELCRTKQKSEEFPG